MFQQIVKGDVDDFYINCRAKKQLKCLEEIFEIS